MFTMMEHKLNHDSQEAMLASNKKALKKLGTIETKKLHQFAGNPRKITRESVRDLANNIRAVGIINPLKIAFCTESQSYEVLDGNRRLMAANLVDMEEVPYQDLGEMTLAECWATFLDLNALTDHLQSEQQGQGIIEHVLADMKAHNYDARNPRELEKYLKINLSDLARSHGFSESDLLKKLKAAREFEFLPDDLRKRAYSRGKYVPRLAKQLAKLSGEDPVAITGMILSKKINNDSAGIASTFLRVYKNQKAGGITLDEALKRTLKFQQRNEKASTNPDSGAPYGKRSINQEIVKEAIRLDLPKNVLEQYLKELCGWSGYVGSAEYKDSLASETRRLTLRENIAKYVLGY